MNFSPIWAAYWDPVLKNIYIFIHVNKLCSHITIEKIQKLKSESRTPLPKKNYLEVKKTNAILNIKWQRGLKKNIKSFLTEWKCKWKKIDQTLWEEAKTILARTFRILMHTLQKNKFIITNLSFAP
jgi:hypothetical protein